MPDYEMLSFSRHMALAINPREGAEEKNLLIHAEQKDWAIQKWPQ